MSNLSIHLKSVSKKFNHHLLYKDIELDILSEDKIVVTGNNGSGKSTLLKIMIGLVSPTSGTVDYRFDDHFIEKRYWHKHVSVAAPYMSMIEEFSMLDLIEHLYVFRKFQVGKKDFLDLLNLTAHLHKPIKQFSSGMKQKTKLLFAIADSAPVLLLDEPISNLDNFSIQWYVDMIERFAKHKTIIVFSNSQKQEYFFCNRHFSLSQ